MQSAPTVWIGIDIAKDSFQACLLRGTSKPLSKQFANAAAGFAKLLRWVQHQAPEAVAHYCLEATGTYSQPLALFLAEADQKVSVVNAFRVKHAALAQGSGNKTDKADALVIARYCQSQNPPLWRLATQEVRVLVALLRRLDTLEASRLQEHNRLCEALVLPMVAASLKKSLAFLDAEIAAIEAQIQEHIDQHPSLKADQELLESIPGIGALTARRILSELPDVDQFDNAQAAAAYAGLNPSEYRSGTSVRKRTRLSKRGNARLRRALYFPAVTAIRCNPVVKALYERLIAKGKPRMVAIGAAMRKLLMLAYGVLKSQRAFGAQAAKSTA